MKNQKKTWKKKKRVVEQRIKEINVQEHVEGSLMSGEGDLSDDFKKKKLQFLNL